MRFPFLRAQLVHRGLASAITHATAMLLAISVTLVLARTLGSSAYGIYSYVFVVVCLLAIPAQFGLPRLVVRETARAHAAAEWPILKGFWRWAGLIALSGSILLALLSAIAAWLFADAFSSTQLASFAWGLALLPLLVLGRLRGAALRGLQHVVAGQMPDTVIRPAILVLAVLALAFTTETALTASVAMALHVGSAAAAFIAGAILLWRAQPTEIYTATPRFRARQWTAAAIPMGITTGMLLINQQADIVLLGFFVTADEVGVYRVAAQAAMLVAFGLQVVNLVASPQFSRLYTRGERRQLQRLAVLCARASLAIALPVALVFIAFGQPLLAFVVGQEYVSGSIALAILAIGQLVNAGMGPVVLLLDMTGHERIVTRTVTIASVGNILANLVLIPLFGLNGAAIASAATFVFWNTMLARAVKQRLGIHCTPFHSPRAS